LTPLKKCFISSLILRQINTKKKDHLNELGKN
jgi:hypothetical protein